MPDTRSHHIPWAAVVYQPFKTDLSALRAVVAQQERASGWGAARWYETSAEDAGVSAARRAVDDGANVVLASGGDGTIRAVAEALRGSGVPVAVVPQGTGNLLARNLGAPLNRLDDVVRAAFTGRNRPIDLGIVRIVREDESESEHVFLVLAGMGLDARAISATKSTLKKRLGWLAYVDAGVRTMISDRPLQIHYSIDRSPVRPLSVYTVMIGNCGLMPGGVLLIPDAQLDDGVIVGQLDSAEGGDEFAFVLPKDSSMTEDVSAAVDTLRENGTLDDLAAEWIADQGAPVLK